MAVPQVLHPVRGGPSVLPTVHVDRLRKGRTDAEDNRPRRPVDRGGGAIAWEELADIYRQAADERRAELGAPPQACPNDGEPLEQTEAGILFCPFDGWQWPRDA